MLSCNHFRAVSSVSVDIKWKRGQRFRFMASCVWVCVEGRGVRRLRMIAAWRLNKQGVARRILMLSSVTVCVLLWKAETSHKWRVHFLQNVRFPFRKYESFARLHKAGSWPSERASEQARREDRKHQAGHEKKRTCFFLYTFPDSSVFIQTCAIALKFHSSRYKGSYCLLKGIVMYWVKNDVWSCRQTF